jgi:hypothetical protein
MCQHAVLVDTVVDRMQNGSQIVAISQQCRKWRTRQPSVIVSADAPAAAAAASTWSGSQISTKGTAAALYLETLKFNSHAIVHSHQNIGTLPS